MDVALHIAASFIGGPVPVLLWAMYADAADYSEWRTRRRATGLVLFGRDVLAEDGYVAVGAAMTGFSLDFFEYAPPIDGMDQAQSETTLNGLCMMMSLIPATFLLLAACCLVFYNINESVLHTIESDLQARKNPKESS